MRAVYACAMFVDVFAARRFALPFFDAACRLRAFYFPAALMRDFAFRA